MQSECLIGWRILDSFQLLFFVTDIWKKVLCNRLDGDNDDDDDDDEIDLFLFLSMCVCVCVCVSMCVCILK